VKILCAHTDVFELERLVEHPKNPNKHPDKQVKMLAKIMQHQGWRHPITVSKRSGFIVAGHGRLQAAKLNGWTEAPVDIQDFENEAQEYQHMIADNKIAELADHDDSMMLSGLEDVGLLDDDVDFDLLGMDAFDLTKMGALADLDAEEKPESEKKFVIEATFPNEMEMMDAHDDLASRGYIVKVK